MNDSSELKHPDILDFEWGAKPFIRNPERVKAEKVEKALLQLGLIPYNLELQISRN